MTLTEVGLVLDQGRVLHNPAVFRLQSLSLCNLHRSRRESSSTSVQTDWNHTHISGIPVQERHNHLSGEAVVLITRYRPRKDEEMRHLTRNFSSFRRARMVAPLTLKAPAFLGLLVTDLRYPLMPPASETGLLCDGIILHGRRMAYMVPTPVVQPHTVQPNPLSANPGMAYTTTKHVALPRLNHLRPVPVVIIGDSFRHIYRHRLPIFNPLVQRMFCLEHHCSYHPLCLIRSLLRHLPALRQPILLLPQYPDYRSQTLRKCGGQRCTLLPNALDYDVSRKRRSVKRRKSALVGKLPRSRNG